MKVIVIGAGGRENAISWKIKNEGNEIFSIPGNGGIQQIGQIFKTDENNFHEIEKVAIGNKIDIIVVGPEVPLSKGIVDYFKNKIKIFGPTKNAAKLESSKSFAKNFMEKYKIPTARFDVIEDFDDGIKKIEKCQFPVVIKYDGLAAGKGVRIVENFEESKKYLEEIFIENIFKGERKVVIEEYLSGVELSYLIFTDTKTYISMVPAKDYKRVFDNDKGPNTGGMGSYSPPNYFTAEIEERIKKQIVGKTIEGLQKENIDYRGVLYFGLMLTEKGPYILEYNVRFGDPETQVILPRLNSDLTEILIATIEGNLSKIKVTWYEEKCICVILASDGYPGNYEKGKEIEGIDKVKNVILFHAGTKYQNNKFYTDGGRVIGITAIDKNIEKAREKVYKAASIIDFEGKHYRKDIGF